MTVGGGPVPAAMPAREPQLHYETFGDPTAPPVVLLHGLGEDGRAWIPQMSALGQDFFLIAPDLAGHGLSPAPAEDGSPPRLADYATALLPLLENEAADLVVLVGEGFGAAVALEFAAAWLERVAALVLVAPFAPGPAPARAPVSDPFLAQGARWRARQWASAGTTRALDAWRTALPLQAAPATGTPVLVCAGEGSSLPAGAIAHARTATIRGAGEFPRHERPEAFNSALTRFLRDVEEHQATGGAVTA